MEKIDTFNIRVYGIIIHQDALLILKEPYAGEILFKFPGGGLEFGESLIEGLKRELKEELNLNLIEASHFYTQEEFMVSKFRANEQLLTIYYKAQVDNIEDLTKFDQAIQELIWVPLKELSTNHVNLPIDQVVVKKLLSELR
ncbi:NUDIX hydrolase [Weeksellaceae bacterium KMM 9713]|uniref:NUDIX hydrolase n=1 Tax=Profundicola chukchiensis TaxID=2961959 RepID=A0A9X4RW70_9FLAO|nr:NUDIX hydrolase [Profundicola chukchiensis]MDG4946665.1 NUDIX hydrolase [Profundicola chukchiensis]